MQKLLVLFMFLSMTMAQTCKLPSSYEKLYKRAFNDEAHDKKQNLVFLSFMCKEGEILTSTVSGKMTRVLNSTCHDGKWEPNFSNYTCKAIRCPRPKDTYCYTAKWTQMETSLRGPEINHEVVFEAKRGYEISEPKAITCVKVTDSKARLNGSRPTCKRLCKKPKIKNGYVLSTNDEDFSSDEFLSTGDYKVRCKRGYRLRKGSNRSFSCTENTKKRRIRFAGGKRPKCVVDKAKNRTKLPN